MNSNQTKFYQNPRFPWTLTLILAGLNVVLLFFLWADRGPKHHRKGGPIRVEQILEFDAEQSQSFQELREGHFKRVDRLRDEMRTHRERAFRQLSGGRPDTSVVKTELQQLGQTTAQIENEIFQHFSSVRKMCKGIQVAKFDQDLMKELLKPHPEELKNHQKRP